MTLSLDNSYVLLYTVYIKAKLYAGSYLPMNIIIHSSSMIPIYEQIVDSVKKSIASGELASGDALPSVRSLAKDLKISALTVKKAYDQLEEDGFTVTVHGKGTYVKDFNPQLVREEQMRELESDMQLLKEKASGYGISKEDVISLFQLIMEDSL